MKQRKEDRAALAFDIPNFEERYRPIEILADTQSGSVKERRAFSTALCVRTYQSTSGIQNPFEIIGSIQKDAVDYMQYFNDLLDIPEPSVLIECPKRDSCYGQCETCQLGPLRRIQPRLW